MDVALTAMHFVCLLPVLYFVVSNFHLDKVLVILKADEVETCLQLLRVHHRLQVNVLGCVCWTCG